MSNAAVDRLRALSPEHRDQVRAQMRRAVIAPDTILIEEGEQDDTLLYIEQGQVRIDRGGVAIDFSGPGEVIGEMALFGEGLRSASVRAVDEVTCLILDGPGFEVLRAHANPFAFWIEREALGQLAARLRRIDGLVAKEAQGQASPWIKPPPSVFERIRGLFAKKEEVEREPGYCNVPELLYGSKIFKGTTWPFLVQIADLFKRRAVAPGTFLCQQGETGDELYVLTAGAVDVLVTTGTAAGELHVHKLATVGPGDAIGLSALADGAPRAASCVATEPTDVLVLDRATWEEARDADHLLGSELRQAVIRGFAASLAEAAGHLVAITKRKSGIPAPPRLPASPGPLADDAAPPPMAEPTLSYEGPAQVFLDPSIGIEQGVPDSYEAPEVDAGKLRAACATEVSRGE